MNRVNQSFIPWKPSPVVVAFDVIRAVDASTTEEVHSYAVSILGYRWSLEEANEAIKWLEDNGFVILRDGFLESSCEHSLPPWY